MTRVPLFSKGAGRGAAAENSSPNRGLRGSCQL